MRLGGRAQGVEDPESCSSEYFRLVPFLMIDANDSSISEDSHLAWLDFLRRSIYSLVLVVRCVCTLLGFNQSFRQNFGSGPPFCETFDQQLPQTSH